MKNIILVSNPENKYKSGIRNVYFLYIYKYIYIFKKRLDFVIAKSLLII